MHALIVAGPTCSGKSSLAIDLAQALDGVVINADSMQVYAELRVLTARPSEADEALVPHRLYGVRPARLAGSAAWWRAAALVEIEAAHRARRLPILCGGTGLYFTALRKGLADIPEPGPAREEARALLRELGSAGLHARLAASDPDTAALLRPTDPQRIARAWEVFASTGRGLASWQAQETAHQPALSLRAVLLDPPRQMLRAAIASRFAGMLAGGAVAEVQALLALGLDPSLPAMRAHGVPELRAWLQGEMSLAEAETRAVQATTRYTRRQATWFRHRPPADPRDTHTIHARYTHSAQFSKSEWDELLSFVRAGG